VKKKGNDEYNRKSGNSPVHEASWELLQHLTHLHFFRQTLRGYRAMARQMQLKRPCALCTHAQTHVHDVHQTRPSDTHVERHTTYVSARYEASWPN